MKTSITIETTPEQEMLIGLAETGHIQKAMRGDVYSWMEKILAEQLTILDVRAMEIASIVDHSID
jgi:hypothetical protein